MFEIEHNGQTYLPDGRLMEVDPPEIDSIVDRQSFTIALADPQKDLYAETDNIMGKEVYVFVMPFNAVTGEKESSGVVLAHSGVVTGMPFEFGLGSLGQVVCKLQCTSPIVNVDASRPFYGSHDFYMRNFPDDDSFIQVYQGSAQINSKWGRV
jgi:hypothetical protein